MTILTSPLQRIIDSFSQEIVDVVLGGEDLMDYDELYEQLFDYFTATGEMPYGVASAKTGDPSLWMKNQLAMMVH